MAVTPHFMRHAGEEPEALRHHGKKSECEEDGAKNAAADIKVDKTGYSDGNSGKHRLEDFIYAHSFLVCHKDSENSANQQISTKWKRKRRPPSGSRLSAVRSFNALC